MVTTVLQVTALWPRANRADQGKDPACDEGSTATGDG